MAEYIKIGVDALEAELRKRTPALLDARSLTPFVNFRRANTRGMQNLPTCWVTPGANTIAEEGQALTEQAMVTVTIGLDGADPDKLVNDGIAYVAAVTDALESVADWGDLITHVHPVHQDYSAKFRLENGFAIFPSVAVEVHFTELPVTTS